jgi:hypothetical protein
VPVDPEIRRLAADPEVIFTIRIIDCCFEGMARDTEPALSVELTAEEIMEDCWRMMKRGLLRLVNDGDDDDAPIVQQTVTPTSVPKLAS